MQATSERRSSEQKARAPEQAQPGCSLDWYSKQSIALHASITLIIDPKSVHSYCSGSGVGIGLGRSRRIGVAVGDRGDALLDQLPPGRAGVADAERLEDVKQLVNIGGCQARRDLGRRSAGPLIATLRSTSMWAASTTKALMRDLRRKAAPVGGRPRPPHGDSRAILGRGARPGARKPPPLRPDPQVRIRVGDGVQAVEAEPVSGPSGEFLQRLQIVVEPAPPLGGECAWIRGPTKQTARHHVAYRVLLDPGACRRKLRKALNGVPGQRPRSLLIAECLAAGSLRAGSRSSFGRGIAGIPPRRCADIGSSDVTSPYGEPAANADTTDTTAIKHCHASLLRHLSRDGASHPLEGGA
jgi:hypothetical protein